MLRCTMSCLAFCGFDVGVSRGIVASCRREHQPYNHKLLANGLTVGAISHATITLNNLTLVHVASLSRAVLSVYKLDNDLCVGVCVPLGIGIIVIVCTQVEQRCAGTCGLARVNWPRRRGATTREKRAPMRRPRPDSLSLAYTHTNQLTRRTQRP